MDHDNNVGTALRAVDLIVQGDGSDSVILDGNGGGNPDWSAGAQNVALFGGTYDIYYTSSATIAIEDGVSVAIDN